ncbi:hypothetical protein EYC80_007750 [Monilinia laxa]|nr:hypothetical protein EYC80_007750 [Monilinia laxa]
MALGISLRNAWLKCSPEGDKAKILANNQSSVAVGEKPRETTSSTASRTIQVVLNKLRKVGQHTFETSKGAINGTSALPSSSSESVRSSLSGFDESGLSDSITNPRGIPSKIQKKRSLIHNADKPARKSPRLSPAIDLPSMARELFAKSIYNFEPRSRPSLTSTPPSRNVSVQSVFEARQECASPGLYSASPPSRTVHTQRTNTPRNTNRINEQPPSSRDNPIIIDDSEDDKEIIRVQSGPLSSTLPSQNTNLRTETPKASGRLKSLSSNSLHGKNTRCIADITKSDDEGQATSSHSSILEVRIPVASSFTRTNSTAKPISSRFKSSSQALDANKLEPEKERKYIPVSNSQFDAYAKTSQMMKNADKRMRESLHQ